MEFVFVFCFSRHDIRHFIFILLHVEIPEYSTVNIGMEVTVYGKISR